MKNLKISRDVLKKLTDKHKVDRREVEQFLAPTNRGRVLKIVYIPNHPYIELRSAFEPNDAELAIYAKYGE